MNGQILTSWNSIKPVARIHIGHCHDSSSSRRHLCSCAIIMCILVTWWSFMMSTIPVGSLVMRVRKITLEQHRSNIALVLFCWPSWWFTKLQLTLCRYIVMVGHSEVWYLLPCEKHDYRYFSLCFSFVNSCFYSINTTEV